MGDMLNTDYAVQLELRGPFFRTAAGDWIGRVPAGLAKRAGDIDQPNLPHITLIENGVALHRTVAGAEALPAGAFAIVNSAIRFKPLDQGDANAPGRDFRFEILDHAVLPDLNARAELLGPFQHVEGLCWSAPTPAAFSLCPSNNDPWQSRSTLDLMEDGQSLSSRQCYIRDIASKGRGAYGHWHGTFYFSTSDGSDPNTNGRSYVATMTAARPKFLGLGSCHMGFVQRALAAKGRVQEIFPCALTHYTGETLQMLRHIRGEVFIPEEFKSYIAHSKQLAGTFALDEVDGVFLEICNTSVLEYQGYYLNRTQVVENIVKWIAPYGQRAAGLASKWFQNGLVRLDEKLRVETSEAMLQFLPKHDAEAELRRDIVRHAKGREQDEEWMVRDVREILEPLHAPACLVAHTLRYMPDGRPMRWPADLYPRLQTVAARLGLRLIDPASYVEAKGAEFSLTPDLEHYTDPFVDFLADECWEAWQISARSLSAHTSR